MSYLQFVASVISSLAWPAVAAYLLFLLRGQLAGLAERIEEWSGFGQHVKFSRLVQTALEKVNEASPPPPPQPRTKDSPPNEQPSSGRSPSSASVAAQLGSTHAGSPFGSILLDYLELEYLLIEIRALLGLSTRTNLISVVRELARRGLVGAEVVESFDALRLARNAAALAERTITAEDARNFNYTAVRLEEVFKFIRTQLKAKESPKASG